MSTPRVSTPSQLEISEILFCTEAYVKTRNQSNHYQSFISSVSQGKNNYNGFGIPIFGLLEKNSGALKEFAAKNKTPNLNLFFLSFVKEIEAVRKDKAQIKKTYTWQLLEVMSLEALTDIHSSIKDILKDSEKKSIGKNFFMKFSEDCKTISSMLAEKIKLIQEKKNAEIKNPIQRNNSNTETPIKYLPLSMKMDQHTSLSPTLTAITTPSSPQANAPETKDKNFFSSSSSAQTQEEVKNQTISLLTKTSSKLDVDSLINSQDKKPAEGKAWVVKFYEEIEKLRRDIKNKRDMYDKKKEKEKNSQAFNNLLKIGGGFMSYALSSVGETIVKTPMEKEIDLLDGVLSKLDEILKTHISKWDDNSNKKIKSGQKESLEKLSKEFLKKTSINETEKCNSFKKAYFGHVLRLKSELDKKYAENSEQINDFIEEYKKILNDFLDRDGINSFSSEEELNNFQENCQEELDKLLAMIKMNIFKKECEKECAKLLEIHPLGTEDVKNTQVKIKESISRLVSEVSLSDIEYAKIKFSWDDFPPQEDSLSAKKDNLSEKKDSLRPREAIIRNRLAVLKFYKDDENQRFKKYFEWCAYVRKEKGITPGFRDQCLSLLFSNAIVERSYVKELEKVAALFFCLSATTTEDIKDYFFSKNPLLSDPEKRVTINKELLEWLGQKNVIDEGKEKKEEVAKEIEPKSVEAKLQNIKTEKDAVYSVLKKYEDRTLVKSLLAEIKKEDENKKEKETVLEKYYGLDSLTKTLDDYRKELEVKEREKGKEKKKRKEERKQQQEKKEAQDKGRNLKVQQPSISSTRRINDTVIPDSKLSPPPIKSSVARTDEKKSDKDLIPELKRADDAICALEKSLGEDRHIRIPSESEASRTKEADDIKDLKDLIKKLNKAVKDSKTDPDCFNGNLKTYKPYTERKASINSTFKRFNDSKYLKGGYHSGETFALGFVRILNAIVLAAFIAAAVFIGAGYFGLTALIAYVAICKVITATLPLLVALKKAFTGSFFFNYETARKQALYKAESEFALATTTLENPNFRQSNSAQPSSGQQASPSYLPLPSASASPDSSIGKIARYSALFSPVTALAVVAGQNMSNKRS